MDAHIGGQLSCRSGHFSHPNGHALNADGIKIDQGMCCDKGFTATGEVRLPGAHIGSQLSCSGGHFSHPDGRALNADGLTVGRGMFCDEGFTATGEVRLLGVHIGGQLNCNDGKFSNASGLALDLSRAKVSGPLHMESAVLEGVLDLTAAVTSGYYDNRNQAFWPQKLRLDRFVYDIIESAPERVPAKERIEWLLRNERGYSPQIYEQLAAVYHRAGYEKDARLILIAKQRRRFAESPPLTGCENSYWTGQWVMVTVHGWLHCGWQGYWSWVPCFSDMFEGT